MTELLSGVEAPSDAELISRVRGGDVAAYGELFSRHVDAARRLGRQLVRGADCDDLVSDAFAKTLQVLQGGGGPDVAFRAYLLTSVRRLHVDRLRASKRVQPSDDMAQYDDGIPFQDTAIASFENGAAAKAFSSLPERWQLVLWHLEVEGQKPADIAPLLGMTANSVSALAYRAREGLRQAFLTMHLADSPTEECRWVNEHLGAYVRKGLSRRDTAKVEEHLDGCRRCTAMYLELDEVNSNLAGIIGPLLLGAAATGYVSAAGSAGLTGVTTLLDRVRDVFTVNAGGGGAGSGGIGTSTIGTSSIGTSGLGGSAGSAGIGGAGAGGAGAGAAGAGAVSASVGAAAAGGAVTAAGGLIGAGSVVAAGVAAVTTAAFVFGGGGGGKEVVSQADRPIGIVQTPAGRGPANEAGAGIATRKQTEDTAAARDTGAAGPTTGSSGGDEAAPSGYGQMQMDLPPYSWANIPAAFPPAAPGTEPTDGTSPDSGTTPDPGTGATDGTADGPADNPDADNPDSDGATTGDGTSDSGTGDNAGSTGDSGSSDGAGGNGGDTAGNGGGTGSDTGNGGSAGGGTGSDTGNGGTGSDTGNGGTGSDTGNGDTEPGSGNSPGPNEPGPSGDPGPGTPGPGPVENPAPVASAVLGAATEHVGRLLTVIVPDAPAGNMVLDLVGTDEKESRSVTFTDAATGCALSRGSVSCGLPAAATQTLVLKVRMPQGQIDKVHVRVTFPGTTHAPRNIQISEP